jgi:hypothetical protein
MTNNLDGLAKELCELYYGAENTYSIYDSKKWDRLAKLVQTKIQSAQCEEVRLMDEVIDTPESHRYAGERRKQIQKEIK